MNFDDILREEPTESYWASAQLLVELAQSDWRCYSSKLYPGTDGLIHRFLRSHARVPGIVSDEIYGARPTAVFYFRAENGEFWKAATFLNGAVLVSKTPTSQTNVLFVDEKTATTWAYPNTHVILADEKDVMG